MFSLGPGSGLTVARAQGLAITAQTTFKVSGQSAVEVQIQAIGFTLGPESRIWAQPVSRALALSPLLPEGSQVDELDLNALRSNFQLKFHHPGSLSPLSTGPKAFLHPSLPDSLAWLSVPHKAKQSSLWHPRGQGRGGDYGTGCLTQEGVLRKVF